MLTKKTAGSAAKSGLAKALATSEPGHGCFIAGAMGEFLTVLVGLDTQEGKAKQDGHQEELDQTVALALLGRVHGEGHGERADALGLGEVVRRFRRERLTTVPATDIAMRGTVDTLSAAVLRRCHRRRSAGHVETSVGDLGGRAR